MATMVKEKRREKKRSKEKPSIKMMPPTASNAPILEETTSTESNVEELTVSDDTLPHDQIVIEEKISSIEIHDRSSISMDCTIEVSKNIASNLEDKIPITEEVNLSPVSAPVLASENKIETKLVQEISDISLSSEYGELNRRLERTRIPTTACPLTAEQELALEAENAYIREEIAEEAILSVREQLEDNIEEGQDAAPDELILEDVTPSAPMFEFDEPLVQAQYDELRMMEREIPKLISMPLEEAINLYGGREMSEVMAMSKKEEAAVEAGQLSGPEHPLMDLLSTFKRSLMAVEREGVQLSTGFREEEKFRNALWKVEKKEFAHSESCPSCNRTARFKGKYEVAELQTEKLPVARMRLEGLLKDVQDSYCHHQHAAILAYYQIEGFISETLKSNKGEIREALTLVLQALKLSDSAPAVLTSALERWAAALAAALVDQRDLRQTLFLIHHLFRQTRSVRWAARVLELRIDDSVGAARAIALLDLLLARPAVDNAAECTEEQSEEWEEVAADGGGGGVSDGSLRERDMLALLRALPLRDLVARILLFTDADITSAREWSWGEARFGRDTLRAACGLRALLHVLTRAAHAHHSYARLRRLLQRVAVAALHALAAAHEHAQSSYAKDMELKVQAELEAAFVGGLRLLDADALPRLPAALLSHHAARDYCISHIVHLHDTSNTRFESLSVDLPALSCEARVRVVAQAAADRARDHELAGIVLEFLFTTAVRCSGGVCPGACRAAARAALPQVLAAHAHLYPAALLLVADASAVEKLDSSVVTWLHVEAWRPRADEVRRVAGEWARRCPALLPPLLAAIDCTPHTGLSLDSQLALGSWLCSHVAPSRAEEWCWAALGRLRVHRALWRLPPDAPPPDPEPGDLFAKAYALMASSWGHCVPVICSEGVEALCELAAARAALALHCLAPIMLLLAPAHDSISLTPRFTDLFTLVLSAGPGLLRRTLGRGGVAPPDLLARLVVEQLTDDQCVALGVGRAWTAALWRAAPALALLDAALPHHLHHCLDEHATQLARAQDEETLQQLSAVTRMGGTAPVACCSALRAWHAQRELLPGLHARLLPALHHQRLTSQRIHVDNALKLIGAQISAEELVIYRAAAAVLAAAPGPAQLPLWRLLLHLYLQRPPHDMSSTTPPVGPLFFSGLIKSRVLAQLKRRLQDSIKHHHNEATALAEAAKKAPKPTISRITSSESRTLDSSLLSPLSISDLAGELSDSSEDSEPSEGEEEREWKGESDVPSGAEGGKDALHAFHVGAERMLTAYAQWLEDERTSALSHEADVARFISEPAMSAAWQQYSRSRQPPPSPAEEREPFPLPAAAPAPPPAPATPFQRAVNTILTIRQRGRRRSQRLTIKSPVEEVDFRDSRSLLALVDKHLKNMEKLSQEWCSEVTRVSQLDAALWRLVGELRVPCAVPALRLACPAGCEPLLYTPPGPEWRKSLETERAVTENRSSALAVTRRLARPRPHAARTAAALLAIARGVREEEGGRAACERAWRAAGAVAPRCAPAAAAITDFFQLVAERVLSNNGTLCASLLSRWCVSAPGALQQALVGALVAPARAPPHLPALHAALLRAALPPHVLFSCLSKFDMGRWAAGAEGASRREVLAALRHAAVRWYARDDDEERQMVAELVGVQSTLVCTAEEVCAHALACCALMATGAWPPPHSRHLVRTAELLAHQLTFDQLGHLLRDIGRVWWEARTGAGCAGGSAGGRAAYAPHVAALLSALHRAFVAAAVRMSYAPERVAYYAWSSLVESWGAWVVPHAAPALLPSVAEEEAYTPMLRAFRQALDQVMLDCPGTEEHLLNQVWEWTVQTHLSVQSSCPGQEARVQMSALLAELAAAPWTSHQWLRGSSLQALLQVCQGGDKEMCVWSSGAVGGQAMSTWLRDASHDALAARLALLLYLFTAAPLCLAEQTLTEAVTLPWQRLPEAALEEALDRFFREHSGAAIPYHELPQFRVILAASEFVWSRLTGLSVSSSSRAKRSLLVSAWLRWAGAPPPRHVPAYQRTLLDIVNSLAPQLDSSEGEVEELLSRAMVILCIEPAAAAALPVWVSWVRGCGARARAGCVRALATLTAPQPFAALADEALAKYLAENEGGGWSDLPDFWRECPWREAAPLLSGARLHAGYGALRAHAHAPQHAQHALLALAAADVDFIKDEVMVAVWICAACRLSLSSAACGDAAAALLRRCAAPPPRSLLRLVTMQPDHTQPTSKHRALAAFALCVTTYASTSTVPAREHEALAAALADAGAGPAAAQWAGPGGRKPRPRALPQLATQLFPAHDHYFRYELEQAPDELDEVATVAE